MRVYVFKAVLNILDVFENTKDLLVLLCRFNGVDKGDFFY